MLDLEASRLKKGLLEEVWFVDLVDYIIDLRWSPDKSRLAAVSVEGGVFLIDDRGDSAAFKMVGQHAGGANSLSWRRDGAEFATAGHDGLAKIWDGKSGEQLAALETGHSWVSKTLYSPRRNVLATAAGRDLKVWNADHDVVYQSSDHASTIADIGWNPKRPGIAAAANLGITLHLSDTNDQPRKFRSKGSSLVLQWSPDARHVATGEQDATVRYWDVESERGAQIQGYSSKVQQLSWDPSGRWLATTGGSTGVLWDFSGDRVAGQKPIQLHARESKLTQIAFQPSGSSLVSTDADGFVFLWHPAEYDQVIGGVLLSSAASTLDWCGNDRLAIGQQDGKVVVFEVRAVSHSEGRSS
ncbi:MAG: WD40 repeat domain-containing protein [Planctomycetota bacterium]